MKNSILLIALSLFMLSCNSDDDTPENIIVGMWNLTGIYLDPGDGSGAFENVNSNKNIVFSSDGTFSSNGIICDLTTETDVSSTGTYSTTESQIDASSCSFIELFLDYSIDNTIMIINYPCIEACQARYEKVLPE